VNATAWFCIGLLVGIVGTMVFVLWMDEQHIQERREA
jgi:hypothetical protein